MSGTEVVNYLDDLESIIQTRKDFMELGNADNVAKCEDLIKYWCRRITETGKFDNQPSGGTSND